MLRYKENIDSLPAAVLEFGTRAFHLGHELTEIKTLCRQERRVAAVLHCGRVLGPLVRHASEARFPDLAGDVPTSLRVLADAGIVSRARMEQFAALNRLVQDAQTARREIHPADLDYAILLTGKVLTWFFCENASGPCLPSEALGALHVVAVADGELAMLVERSETADVELEATVGQHRAALLRSPVGAGLLLQAHVGREGRIDSNVLHRVRELTRTFPEDDLLHRLMARVLWWQGDRRGALLELETALGINPLEPDVLVGLGDWHQDSWVRSQRTDEAALHRAVQYYQLAWSHSRESDLRAGTEAAVLGLERGRRERSESIAQIIVEGYHRRFRAMGSAFRFRNRADRFRLAHAALILGEWQYARRRYNEALIGASRTEVLEVKRRLKLLLPLVGIEHSATRFLTGSGPRRRRSSRQLALPFIETEARGGAAVSSTVTVAR